MLRKVINRTGEEGVNNFGRKIIIKEYRKYSVVDVNFSEYNWMFEHAQYSQLKNGSIKGPYEPR